MFNLIQQDPKIFKSTPSPYHQTGIRKDFWLEAPLTPIYSTNPIFSYIGSLVAVSLSTNDNDNITPEIQGTLISFDSKCNLLLFPSHEVKGMRMRLVEIPGSIIQSVKKITN